MTMKMRPVRLGSETAVLYSATPIPICGMAILKAETAIHIGTAVAAGDYYGVSSSLVGDGGMTISCILPLSPSSWQNLAYKAIQIGAIDFASDQVADNSMQITSIYPSAIPISR